MYYLTEVQIEIIKNEVHRHNIFVTHLADDMVDHICCDVEEEIWNGATFDDAYKKIIDRIGGNGLQEIQKETLYLTDKNYRIMKKSMKIIGMSSMLLVALGTLFKIQHWPGASIMLVLGFLILACVFFPVAVSATWKETKLAWRRFLNITGVIGGIAMMFGILFKIQHYPGANIFLLLGYNIISLLFLPSYVFAKYRDKTVTSSKTIYVIGAIALILALEGSLFKILHYPGATILLLSGTIMLSMVFLPMLYQRIFKNSEHVKGGFIILCFGLMMFNLLTILIAMNVSKSVLDDFIRPDMELSVTARQLHTKNIQMHNQLVSDSLVVNKSIRGEIDEINKKSESLYKFISDIKAKLALLCLSKDYSEQGKDFISSKNFMIKDNSNFASNLIISGGLGHEIKLKFEELKNTLLPKVSGNELAIQIINKTLDTSAPNMEGETWETFCFQNTVSVCSFNRLTYLQCSVEIATAEVYEHYINNIVPIKKSETIQLAELSK